MPKYQIGDEAVFCSFCGATPEEREAMLVTDGGAAICDECVSTCVDAIRDFIEKKKKRDLQ